MPVKESISFKIDSKLAKKLRDFAKKKDLTQTDAIIACINYRLHENSPAHAINKGFRRMRKRTERVEDYLETLLSAVDLFIRDYFAHARPIDPEDRDMAYLDSTLGYENFYRALKSRVSSKGGLIERLADKSDESPLPDGEQVPYDW